METQSLEKETAIGVTNAVERVCKAARGVDFLAGRESRMRELMLARELHRLQVENEEILTCDTSPECSCA